MESKNNDETSLSNQETYQHRLKRLECPFIWRMDTLLYLKKFTDEKYCSDDIDDSLPLQKLLYAIITVYVNMKDGKKDNIEDDLKKCHHYLDNLIDSEDPEISSKVARAILQATECFVYFELNNQEELELQLKDLENIDNMSDKEKSTLLGCKSICWSRYDKDGSSEAKDLILEAIKLNENCALWHYVLGKIIRHNRRTFHAGTLCHEEINSFLKAYEMSKYPIYGIFVAQTYRESKQYFKASMIFNHLFEDFDSLSTSVLLRLALGFIGDNQLDKAKTCLDKAEKGCAKRSMYFHYRAKYHIKRREFEEASRCFKEAVSDGNLFAEMEYFHHFLSDSADATIHLENLLDKYKSLSETQLQPVMLHVAFSYWSREEDLKQAIKYFLKAIEIDPQAKCLTAYYSSDILELKCKNVYVFLETNVFPEFEDQSNQFDEDTLKIINSIKEYCKIENKALS